MIPGNDLKPPSTLPRLGGPKGLGLNTPNSLLRTGASKNPNKYFSKMEHPRLLFLRGETSRSPAL